MRSKKRVTGSQHRTGTTYKPQSRLDLESLKKAVDSLEETISLYLHEKHSHIRLKRALQYGVIQNFECTYELSWKFMKRWIELHVGKVLKADAATKELPIVMLTTKGEHSDIILGLQHGADDYVVKPIVPGILLARITAVMRRAGGGFMEEKILAIGTVRLDLEQRTCTVKNKDIHLLPKEFELLAVLMKRSNKVLTREELLSRVWGYQYFGTTRTLDTTIMRLRKKLGAEGKRIETAQTVGYRFLDE